MTFHSTEQFVEFYYQTFDGNRSGLAPLYVRPYPVPTRPFENVTLDLHTDGNCEFEQRDQSMLTFETSSVQGTAAIVEKLGVCSPPIATDGHIGILMTNPTNRAFPSSRSVTRSPPLTPSPPAKTASLSWLPVLSWYAPNA